MTLGVSLILIAAGAILIWGVTGEVSGLDVDAIGVILIVVGIIGFILSLVFWDRWGGARGPWSARRTYVERGADPAAPVSRTRVVEERVDEPPAGSPPP